MHSHHHHAPYWGKPTSNIDWCEENYTVTEYIAEFWNALSSLALVFYGVFGVYIARKYQLERSVMLSNFTLILVGIGSTLFHATLLYEYQLTDELPMIYGDIALCYLVFADHIRKPTFTKILPFILLSFAGLISFFMYLDPNNPLFLQVGYVCQVVIITAKSAEVAYKNPGTRSLFWLALTAYVSASVCWLLDRFLCYYVQPFQLHSMWHALAAYGTYMFIVFATYHRLHNIYQRKPAVRSALFGLALYVYPVDFYNSPVVAPKKETVPKKD